VCDSSSSDRTDGPPASDDAGSPGPGQEQDTEDTERSTQDWRSALERAGTLAPDVVELLLATHGDRGRRAIDAVAEERVKAYRDFTVVVGHADEYIVEDGACTCKDATYNLDTEDPDQQCWHALAVVIARRIDAVDHHDMWYADVRELL
jgi:predicted nucleic acid-binding Zn finger protein